MNFDKAPSSEKKEKLPNNFNEVLERMKLQQENDPILFAGTKNDLKNMADGEDLEDIRKEI